MDALWQSISKWNEMTDVWMNESFSGMNAEQLNTEVLTFVKDSFSAHKKVWKPFTASGSYCFHYSWVIRE